MNTLLINPNSPNIARISLDFELNIDNVGRFPPVGLISLAAFIRKNSGHKIELIDCGAEDMEKDALFDVIREKKIELVGITSFTYTFYDVLELCRSIKKEFPNIGIVLGGPHTLLFAKETLLHPEIDYLVIGEGEDAFLYLLDALSKGNALEKRDGLAFRQNNEIFAGKPVWVKELDKLPFPAYDLLDADKYQSTFGYGGKTITLCTSRGCPYQCTYCQAFPKAYRTNSVPYVVEYIKTFYKEGYKNFYFFDDTFNITTSRVIEFSKRLIAENIDIKWTFRGRINSINEELCKVASKAGCVQILFGVEDHTDEGLAEIKKNITISQVKKAVACVKKHKIGTHTNWIIGLPTHKSAADLENLINTAIEIDSDYAMFTILQLLPGCEMFEQAVKDGAMKKSSWRDYIMNPVPSHQIEFYDKYISGEDLSRFYSRAYKRFYRRPGYIARRVFNVRSLSELKSKIPVALNVLFHRSGKHRKA